MVFDGIRRVAAAVALLVLGGTAPAADYDIDTMHGFIEFKVSHMGFSMISGRFAQFDGVFSWDQNDPSSASAEIVIQMASVDTNHAERDNHLRSSDYLTVANFPTATFTSTGYDGDANGGTLRGDLTLNGVTQEIALEVSKVGEGKDPWGGYRAGFSGVANLRAEDFGYTNPIFPQDIELEMSVEGVQQQ